MKKIASILLVSLLLCGCSSNQEKTAPAKGKIDCSYISVENSGHNVFYGSYGSDHSPVYAYKSADSEMIYANQGFSTSGEEKFVLSVYKDKYSKEHKEFVFDGFVGWLTLESNYYLDLDTRTIDCETKYSEYLYDENPDGEKAEADNKKAFACAKKGYYQTLINFYRDENGNFYGELRTYSSPSALVSHKYISVGSDSVITYKVK